LVTNGTFDTDLNGWTGTNWSWSAGTALHTAGSTSPLSQNISVTNGTTYQVEFVISGRTAGGVTVTIGTVTLVCYPWGNSFSENGTFQCSLVAAATGAVALSFTPTSDFDGALDNVTVKAITGTIPSLVQWKNSAGTTVLEARGDATLDNSASGLSALARNTNGYYNSAQGVRALANNITGSYNTAQGLNALYSNTNGYYNSAQGVRALYNNTTGFSNSAQGVDALYNNTTGFSNSAQGLTALYNNTTGSYNTAQGLNALANNTTGSYNTAQGVGAGRFIADGSSPNQTSNTSVYLGGDTKALANGDSNEVVIGYNATGAGSNTATLGNTSITLTVLRGTVELGTEAKWNSGTEGTCDASKRGRVVVVYGGAGVADTFRVCRKDAADAYAWVSLY
jgi:hypothetical protein